MATRGAQGRFAKKDAEDALESISAAITAGGEVDASDLPIITAALEEKDEQIKKMTDELQGIRMLGSATAYTEKRDMEKLLQKEKAAHEKVKKELGDLKKLEDQDLLLGRYDELDLKVAKPEPFDGKPENVDGFITACELVFQTSTKKFEHNKARIFYVLSYCTKGVAIVWRDKVLRDMSNVLDELAQISLDEKIGGWEAFVRLFKGAWKGTHTTAEAQVKLQHIYQGNRGVEEYYTEFRLLALDSQLRDDALLIFFKKGLKEVIKRRIFDSGTLPRTLTEWVERARIIDQAWKESELDRRGSGWKSAPGKIRYAEEKRKRLPDDEYQKRRKEGLCYKCGNKGHLAKDCFAKGRRIQEDMKDLKEETRENKQDFV